jgi:cation transport regulator ChaC
MPVWTVAGASPGWLPCWTYLPVLTYENYNGALPLERQAALVAVGSGSIGSALEYLTLLLEECGKLGVQEPSLERLLAEARRLRPEGQAAAS